jgi:hypothetical protein
MRIIQPLLDFLELRPFFTLRLIRVFWWLYLAVQLQRLWFEIMQLAVSSHAAIQAYINPLDTLVLVMSVRLLLEIVLSLTAYCTTKSGARVLQRVQASSSPAARLAAFFTLDAFFTPPLLAIYWGLFLILQLRLLLFVLQSAVPMLMSGEGGAVVWDGLLIQLIFIAAYTAGIRLMVEVELAVLRRDQATADRILSS